MLGNVRREEVDMFKISEISYKPHDFTRSSISFTEISSFSRSAYQRQHWHAQRHGVPNKVLYGESLPQE